MSRCFPFPPPGFEKKPKAENLDLLTKEKRKEKKHKKEKKEKEKREHKEKKEKDRSKDKRKEKKDRKEKHRDRKRDKDIDKGRSSEDRRAEDRNEGTHNRDGLHKSEEVKDFNFAEELGKRTKDDAASNRMVGSIPSSLHRKIEQMDVARPPPSLEKNSRVADKKVFPVPIGSSQRNDGSILPTENATNIPHRRIGNINTTTSMDQERNKLHERFTVGDQNRNHHAISRSIEVIPGLVNRKADYSTTAGTDKEKPAERNVVPNSIAPAIDNKGKLGAKGMASTTRKNDLLGNSFIQSKTDGTVTVPPPSIEKERVKGSGMFPRTIGSEQGRNATFFQPVQKDRNEKVEKKDEVIKGFKDKEHSAKKNKPKDTDKHNKEEEEKIVVEKAAVIENNNNNNIRNFGRKDNQIETLNNSKPLAPHKDNTTGVIRGLDEGSNNKRKNLKMNGFILENDARPNKIPRMVASSSQPPLKPDGIVLLDHKKKEINGSAKPQQLPDGNGGEVSLKSPHPDSKYLEQIFSVPKMEPWPENDDLEWLFNRRDSSQQKPVSEESDTSQVWGEALWIESADVLALPYVLPF